MEKLNEMRELLNELEADFERFYINGRGLSGPEIRKGMQKMKVLCQDVRVNVMDIIKQRQAAKKSQ